MIRRSIVERSPRPRGIGLRIAFCVACAAFGLGALLHAARLQAELIEVRGAWLIALEQNGDITRVGIAQHGALLRCSGEVDAWQERATSAGALFLMCDNQRRELIRRSLMNASNRLGDAPIIYGDIQ